MNAIRVRRHIDSETLHLPELREVLGQDVEIIILPSVPAEEDPLETGETLLGDALHRPPLTAAELEELREAARDDEAVAALLELYDRGGLDVEAIVRWRNESPIRGRRAPARRSNGSTASSR